MSYALAFSEIALEDIEKHKKVGDKAVLVKIDKLLKELMMHPIYGTGHPKPLKHNLIGFYSRRINQKHRLVYSIKEEMITIHVLSLWGHYDDK